MEPKEKQKVIVYVDGFNFYYGSNNLFFPIQYISLFQILIYKFLNDGKTIKNKKENIKNFATLKNNCIFTPQI